MTSFTERVQAALASGYTVERELTGGGMSHVYLATERALGRKVVVKVLPPDLAAGVNRERFRREIHLAAQLQHPHIVPLLTAGEEGDLLYYTMPYVTGESLRARLEEKGRLPVRDVVRILTDVVDALAYAHAHGVMHRDIKPGNVLTQRSHALVTDFGVAKALSAALPLASSTTSGMAIGTPAYMAPEQLAADPAADHRVDLYAVGLLAYELLTGEAPFTGASPAATMAAQLTRDPAPLETVRSDVPAPLSDIIRRCLSKDPGGRPESAEALLAELEELPHDPSTPTRSVAALGGPARARKSAGLAAIATVAATVAIAVFVSQREPGRTSVEVESGAPPLAAPAAPSAAPSPTPQASVLTRADSMAIAEAVRRELARENTSAARTERRPAPARHVDSLSQAFERLMIDSLVRLNALKVDERLSMIPGFEGRVFTAVPPVAGRTVPAGPRPVRVAGMRDSGALAGAEQALVDSLKRRLARTPGFVVVDDSAEPADGRAPEIVVTARIARAGNDSVQVRVDLIDPLAAPSFIHRVVRGPVTGADEPLRNVRDIVGSAAATLAQMAKAPRNTSTVWRMLPREGTGRD